MKVENYSSPDIIEEVKSIPDIIAEVKSGIIHIVHVVDGRRVSSGTGFMVHGCLVTNYHVMYQAPKESKVILRKQLSRIGDKLTDIAKEIESIPLSLTLTRFT
ncbi:hypothetical protein [Anabaena sp. 4-3]|uniref:hypothetical protein n=1 Tax=Anabaena sp. 4-3 TaxID=1811979 RepID=UPI0008297626|nr:hypothetical protein [Anabaena sp. 4-3]